MYSKIDKLRWREEKSQNECIKFVNERFFFIVGVDFCVLSLSFYALRTNLWSLLYWTLSNVACHFLKCSVLEVIEIVFDCYSGVFKCDELESEARSGAQTAILLENRHLGRQRGKKR